MKNLVKVIHALEDERKEICSKIGQLELAMQALDGFGVVRRAKVLHWTQRPGNHSRVMLIMRKARRGKAA